MARNRPRTQYQQHNTTPRPPSRRQANYRHFPYSRPSDEASPYGLELASSAAESFVYVRAAPTRLFGHFVAAPRLQSRPSTTLLPTLQPGRLDLLHAAVPHLLLLHCRPLQLQQWIALTGLPCAAAKQSQHFEPVDAIWSAALRASRHWSIVLSAYRIAFLLSLSRLHFASLVDKHLSAGSSSPLLPRLFACAQCPHFLPKTTRQSPQRP